MKKKFFLPLISLFLISCSTGATSEIKIEVKEDVNILEGIKLDYDNAIFDDFSNGVNSSYWDIANHAWGNGNGGCVPENVHYTDDGILFLQGNGKYYSDGDIKGVGDVKDGRYTGAALISKFSAKPGRYEVKMKPLPRQGACTAFWTFAYQFTDELENKNHEIDIELPGGSQTGIPTFENILNTNYQTETKKQSQDTPLKNIFDENVYLNDGSFHTFGFDWYTDPELIVYYVDNKICAISDSFVPNLESKLWLGVWFPVSTTFVGTANFEKDIMEVDYVKYIPFLDQPYTPFTPSISEVATLDKFPNQSESLLVSNLISNGTFEYYNGDKENKGWTFSKYIDENQNTDLISNISTNEGFEDSKCGFIKDGGIIQQDIDSVYSSFKYNFSFEGKGKGNVTLSYLGNSTIDKISQDIFSINNTSFEHFEKQITIPEGTKSIRILIDTENGSSFYIDNISMIK